MKDNAIFFLVLFGFGGVVVWLLLRKQPLAPNYTNPVAEPCGGTVQLPGLPAIGANCGLLKALPGLAPAYTDAAIKTSEKIFAAPVTVAKDAVHGVKCLFGGCGINCSVAQQPENALNCRVQYGYKSAPGSDAWARAHGQQPIYTGPGST